jgi:hypothetical protein
MASVPTSSSPIHRTTCRLMVTFQAWAAPATASSRWGSGEMSSEAFTGFLKETLGNAAAMARDGSIAFVCMDWRHMGELLAAGEQVFSSLKSLCVWNKTNGGMGSFYRSKHELVFVFKVGTAPHTNTFSLGESGRYRTNVWDYAGVNALRAHSWRRQSILPARQRPL